jgi:hypothetical protein
MRGMVASYRDLISLITSLHASTISKAIETFHKPVSDTLDIYNQVLTKSSIVSEDRLNDMREGKCVRTRTELDSISVTNGAARPSRVEGTCGRLSVPRQSYRRGFTGARSGLGTEIGL